MELQHQVFDEHRFVARLDMAWVGFRVALEYDGRDHAVDDRRGGDLDRVREALLARGWAPGVRAS